MFTKEKKVGEIYVTVTDWKAVFNAIGLVLLALMALSLCHGN